MDAKTLVKKKDTAEILGPSYHLFVDVEACNPVTGPLRAIGVILSEYQFMSYRILKRRQWIVRCDMKQYDGTGKEFWLKKGLMAHQHLDKMADMTSEQVALEFRTFLNECFAAYTNLTILIDDIHVDFAILNSFLIQHKYRPVQYDHKELYHHNVKVSRDLVRGSFSMVQPKYNNLKQIDLQKAVAESWANLRFQTHKDYQKPNFLIQLSVEAYKVVVSRIKHVPLYDCERAMLMFYQMEDLKRDLHSKLSSIGLIFF